MNVSFEHLRFVGINHTLIFTATNMTVTGAESARPLVFSPSAKIQITLIPLFAGHLEIHQVEFDSPMIYIERSANSTLNWRMPNPESDSAVRFNERWTFGRGKIDYRDLSADPSFETLIDFASLNILAEQETGALKISAKFHPLRLPGHSLELDSRYEPEIDEASFKLNDNKGNFVVEGTVKAFQALPRFRGTIKLRGAQTSELLKQVHGFPGMPNLSGILTASAEVQGEGVPPKTFSKRLNFSGALEIRHGMIWGNNVIRALFKELGIAIPITPTTYNTDNTDSKFEKMFVLSDTPFDILKLQIKKSGDRIVVSDLLIQSKNYLLSVNGTYAPLDQMIELQGKIVVLDDATAWCIKQWPQLAVYRNPQNRLSINFETRGIVPNPTLFVGSHVNLSHNSRDLPS
jgi:hypothetical protein